MPQFNINGESTNDHSGRAVSSAGDVNGDGFADFIIGAFGSDANGKDSGAAYVVFGSSGFNANLDLSSLNGSNGFQISGEAAYDFAGYSVSAAGDVNGDGFGDLIIGAYGVDAHGSNSGAAYVVFGKASGFPAELNLSSLDGTNGFQISGKATNDYTGISVSSAGDVNGDGFADLIIGAPFASPHGTHSGASSVVFGKASGFGSNFDLSSLNGSNGFQISGKTTNDYTGISVSGAGDINGDGFDDVIVGAPLADPTGTSSGAAYVIFGRASGFSANLDVSSLNGGNGFQVNGESAGNAAGFSVSDAGDFNGDGFGDVIIGAFGFNPFYGSHQGASYVVFGKSSGFGSSFNLSSLNGSNGIRFIGLRGDYSGFSVSAAGDVNGDGFSDLLIGAPAASASGNATLHPGAAYLALGAAFSASASVGLDDPQIIRSFAPSAPHYGTRR